MNKLKVALLGGGSWGTSVASLVAKNTEVSLWARDSETVAEINELHTNEKYLPGAKLPSRLKAYNDIGDTVADIDVLVMGVPSSAFRSVLREVRPHLRPWVPAKALKSDSSDAATFLGFSPR